MNLALESMFMDIFLPLYMKETRSLALILAFSKIDLICSCEIPEVCKAISGYLKNKTWSVLLFDI